MKKLHFAAGLALLIAVLLAPFTAVAQQNVPYVRSGASVVGYLSIAAGTSSSAGQALPGSIVTYNAVTLYNSGSQGVYYVFGDSGVVATTSPSGVGAGYVPPGTKMVVYPTGAYIATITTSSTSTLQLWQAAGPVDLGTVGGSGGGGSGTVTSVSVVTANGVSGSVANPTTTPAITLALGAITPSSVTVGAGSAITSSGPGGVMTPLAYTSPGTGVAAALGVNTGTVGAFVVNGGALGTPSSGVATNLTGTASGLTAGNVAGTGAGSLSSLALGGATIGSNALAVTGTSAFSAQLSVTGGGVVLSGANANFTAGGNGLISWTSNSALKSPANGTVIIGNNNFTAFTLLALGNNTSSFPALKVNGSNIDFRVGDDTAYSSIRVLGMTVQQTPTAITQATTMTFSSAADSASNIGHRCSFNMNGTTYWFPCSSVAF